MVFEEKEKIMNDAVDLARRIKEYRKATGNDLSWDVILTITKYMKLEKL